MANLSNILLAGALAGAAYIFSKKKEKPAIEDFLENTESKETSTASNEVDKNKTTNTSTSSSAPSSTSSQTNLQAATAAAKKIEKIDKQYASKVTVSDVTMQYFNTGSSFTGLYASEFPFRYIIWAKFRNTSNINVLVDITDVTATIVHTTNSQKLPINRNLFVIPAKTETIWLPIVVAQEYLLKNKKIFDDVTLTRDIKENFPRIHNFFLPAHFMIKYNVEIPNQDTILAKDVIAELNGECLSLNTKGDAGWWGLSSKTQLGVTFFNAGDINTWVMPANRAALDGYTVFHKSDSNMLNPSNNSSYQSYLDVLRNRAYVRSNAPYKGYPTKYNWLKDYEQGTKTQASYRVYRYEGGKLVPYEGKVYHPYSGIVYDPNGVVAYE